MKLIFFQDQQEAHVQPQHNQVTVVAQKKPLEVAEDDADDIDLPTVPPPMKIQDHIFKAASKEDSSEDLSKKVSVVSSCNALKKR